MPGVRAGSASREFGLGVCAGSSCREVLPRVIRGSGFVLRFVLFALFAASVQFDPGGDSVRTGLPVLVSSRAGDSSLYCCHVNFTGVRRCFCGALETLDDTSVSTLMVSIL